MILNQYFYFYKMERKKKIFSNSIKGNCKKKYEFYANKKIASTIPKLETNNYDAISNIKQDLNYFNSNENVLTISNIKKKIKNPQNFIKIFGVVLKYHLPPKHNITWPFIIGLLTGDKQMIKVKDIPFLQNIPKIKELQMKKIWPSYKNNKEICRYLPDVEPGRYPPRNFFFQILSARRNNFFQTILKIINNKRKKKIEKKSSFVKLSTNILTELKGTKFEELFINNNLPK